MKDTKKKHVVIPIFVSHMGCPFNCIFCDQRKISGQKDEITPAMMTQTIDLHLSSIEPGTYVEIGFYGGSFTGIPIETQLSLLENAQKYVNAGIIKNIRLSTRPDYINEHILSYLKHYGVGLIELGVQSLDNEVLRQSCRGHSREDSLRAFEAIKKSGIKLGVQTMIGLVGDSPEKALSTAITAAEYKPETVRIYPTLVIKGTELERLFFEGKYSPLSLQDAVDITAQLLDVYYEKNINVIRVGLQPTSELNESSEVTAGPFHPAFRHLSESRLMRNKIDKLLRNISGNIYSDYPGSITIYANPGKISEAAGYKRENIEYLKSKYGFKQIKIKSKAEIGKYEVKI